MEREDGELRGKGEEGGSRVRADANDKDKRHT